MPFTTNANSSDVSGRTAYDERVKDYIDDKIQNGSDFANIDSLLESVRAQHILLQRQVSIKSTSNSSRRAKYTQLHDAKETLNRNLVAFEEHSTNLLQQGNSFQSRQADIDRRLLIVTRSETSDDAVRKFDSSIVILQKLDVAQGYMGLLTEVEYLSSDARQNFTASPQAALKPYLRLQDIANALRGAQPAAEDAAPHLIDHVDRIAWTLWRQMKDTFGGDFSKTLKKIRWPERNITMDEHLKQEWTNGVKRLLELQEPELKARDSQTAEPASQEQPLVLIPLEVMVKPLEIRFKYHFEGDKPTNKLDKVSDLDKIHIRPRLTRVARIFSISCHWATEHL